MGTSDVSRFVCTDELAHTCACLCALLLMSPCQFCHHLTEAAPSLLYLVLL